MTVDNTGRLGDEAVGALVLQGNGTATIAVDIAQWSDRPVVARVAVLQDGTVVPDSPTTGGEEISIVTAGVDPQIATVLKGYLAQLAFAPVQNLAGQAIATNAEITVRISRIP